MPRSLFELILTDNTPIGIIEYGVLSEMLKADMPNGW